MELKSFRKWLFEMCQPTYYKYRKPELFKKVRIDLNELALLLNEISWGK